MIKLKKVNNIINGDVLGNERKYNQNPDLAEIPMRCMIVAPSMTGKTVACVNLLKAYEKSNSFDNWYCISPTYYNDGKLQNLPFEKENIYTHPNNESLEGVLGKVIEEYNGYKQYLKNIEKLHQIKQLKPDLINENHLEWIEKTHREGGFKTNYSGYPSSVLVIDDSMETPLLSKTNHLSNSLFTKARQYGLSIVCLVQYFKGISKTIRNQISLWMIFRTYDQELLDDIYREVSFVPKQDFDTIYRDATKGNPYDFLYIDIKKREFRKNFNEQYKI